MDPRYNNISHVTCLKTPGNCSSYESDAGGEKLHARLNTVLTPSALEHQNMHFVRKHCTILFSPHSAKKNTLANSPKMCFFLKLAHCQNGWLLLLQNTLLDGFLSKMTSQISFPRNQYFECRRHRILFSYCANLQTQDAASCFPINVIWPYMKEVQFKYH